VPQAARPAAVCGPLDPPGRTARRLRRLAESPAADPDPKISGILPLSNKQKSINYYKSIFIKHFFLDFEITTLYPRLKSIPATRFT
jgi:hypothetical protein